MLEKNRDRKDKTAPTRIRQAPLAIPGRQRTVRFPPRPRTPATQAHSPRQTRGQRRPSPVPEHPTAKEQSTTTYAHADADCRYRPQATGGRSPRLRHSPSAKLQMRPHWQSRTSALAQIPTSPSTPLLRLSNARAYLDAGRVVCSIYRVATDHPVQGMEPNLRAHHA